jgi:hypothetical protein
MKFKHSTIFLLLLSLFFQGKAQNKTRNIDLKKLYLNMLGSFHNGLQSKSESNIELILLKTKPIWQNDQFAYWLFVEQSNTKDWSNKYNQSIYKLFKMNDSVLVKQIYLITEPKPLKGKWKNKKYIQQLSSKNIILKKGCAVFYTKNKEGIFMGRTHDTDCPNNVNGAFFETKIETISPHLLLILNQGFDANGKQVWGETNNGYKFLRQIEY